MEQACQNQIPALDLGVELKDPAGKIYRKVGFRPQWPKGGSLAMVLDLACDERVRSE